MPTVRDFSGRTAEISSNVSDVWKRRPGEVGLNFLTAMLLHPFEELDRLLARRQPYVSLLPGLPLADEAAHPLPLALAVRDADRRDLDAEELLNRAGDLDLVRVASDLEADGVRRILQACRLLGDERPPDDLLRIHHSPPRVATTRDSA